MTKWEYLTIELKRVKKDERTFADKIWKTEAITKELNEYGQKGWELVDFIAVAKTPSDSQVFATFKKSIERDF